MRHDAAEPETRAREETISDRGREARENRVRSVRRYAGTTVALAFLFGIGLAAAAGHDIVVLVVESLALLAAAAAAFVVAFAPSRGGRPDLAEAHANAVARARQRRRRTAARRFASSLALVALFAAGASLSAAGGDVLIPGLTGTAESTSTETDTTGTTETAPTTTAPEEAKPETPAEDGTPPPPPAAPETPAAGGVGTTPPAAAPTPPPSNGGKAPTGSGAGTSSGSDADTTGGKDTKGSGAEKGTEGSKGSKGGRKHDHGHAVLTKKKVRPLPLDPEARSSIFHSTVWLHRELPDPTPPSKRLTREFAVDLVQAADAAGVRWSLILAVLRARGHDGRAPADRAELDALAQRLAALGAAESGRRAVAQLEDARFAKQARALARYNRAVGLWALVHGLEAAQERLEKRVLRDDDIDVYPGGRSDIEAGRIDVRVLVLLRYLRIAHDQVTVSSLFTGHGFFARPGVPSAHMSGLAVDISMLNGKSITGNQEIGGLTDRAVQNILRLPTEVQPRQVISLLAMGGASFAMANHYDHIHVGF